MQPAFFDDNAGSICVVFIYTYIVFIVNIYDLLSTAKTAGSI